MFPWLTLLSRSHFQLVVSVTRYHSAEFSDSAWDREEGQREKKTKRGRGGGGGLFLDSSPE